MLNKKAVLAIVTISFCLAVSLGMLDHETESLIHLFTAELGNLIALLLYTGLFSGIGLGIGAVLSCRHSP